MEATITRLTLVNGYWLAQVHDGTDAIWVDNRIGPWTTPVEPHADHSSNQIVRRELVPEVSAKLRELVRNGGGDATVTFKPAAPAPRPQFKTTAPVEPSTPTNTTTVQAIAQQMAAAGAAAVRKAA